MVRSSAKNPHIGSQDTAQADRFKQTAKEVGADESEAAFEDKLRRLAKAKTPAPKVDAKGSTGRRPG